MLIFFMPVIAHLLFLEPNWLRKAKEKAWALPGRCCSKETELLLRRTAEAPKPSGRRSLSVVELGLASK